ncbi:hypothetical protein Nepgr_032309 [Nepenthes gracilis]|uniref:Protein kinase domain-containing protein n=1 Tax=Nepenthes gracilis TaxID=150966 RepID=A0AAD3Y869_NEPGR|nr:hypothetical protein Nepgr_032309 [Nepenthes gracilis]
MSFISPPLNPLVEQAMGGRWNAMGFQFICYMILFFSSGLRDCSSLNVQGLNLLKFRERVRFDPYNAFESWNPDDENPCIWFGVHCVDGKVQMLNLGGLSLEGTMSPELGHLSDLKVLVLYGNNFSGVIPKELGKLKTLELLDLRDNNLSGKIPFEIGKMMPLTHLMLCGNKFEGSIPRELEDFSSPSELQFDPKIAPVASSGIGCIIRKSGNRPNFVTDSMFGRVDKHGSNLRSPYEPSLIQNVHNLKNFARRRLPEQSSNLKAASAQVGSPPTQILSSPTSHSSGSFPAVSSEKNQSHPHFPTTAPAAPLLEANKSTSNYGAGNPSEKVWIYVAVALGVALLIAVAAAGVFVCRSRGVTTIGPWKTGISGQLQKAFTTGVPKLNRSELELACEDFSNIIESFDGCTLYKGTLSSGVEIAVASTSITSAKDWSQEAEMAYRKKIETLSRVNHKNFVNLIGYCEEVEPFVKMMVFEYAPNGTLFEHLHVKEVEHLDWVARMRIIMGMAYCLQYMHDLNPPVAHSKFNSLNVYLTDDYAAKIAEVPFSKDVASKAKASDENEHKNEESPLPADPESSVYIAKIAEVPFSKEAVSKAMTSGEDEEKDKEWPLPADRESNVYSFGVLLLEIISGRLPYSEEQGSLVNWAAQYLNDKQNLCSVIDPTLKSFKNNELETICDVIQECVRVDPKQRPPMKEIALKLREGITMAPDAAVPRLSPLWWAELELLSSEAA